MPEPVDMELSLRAGNPGYLAELRIRLGDDSELRQGPFPVVLDIEALRALGDQVEPFSQALTSALFADNRLLAAFSEARGRGEFLRLRLTIAADAGELHGLCWELLAAPGSNVPFSLNEKVYFSRYQPSQVAAGAALPQPRGMLRALAAAANPSNLSAYKLQRIDTTSELARAEAGLSPIRVDRLPASPGDLCTLQRLLDRSRVVDILYLACHGAFRRNTAALFLEGDDGKVKRATGEELAERVSLMENRPRLVVLASCESAALGAGEGLLALGPLLVLAGVPAVVAMQGPISMETLAAFLPVFFRELAVDGRIDRAMSVARLSVRDHADWWSPALLMNLLSGRLWEEAPGLAEHGVNPLDVPHEVPAPPVGFIGREVELVEMTEALATGLGVINIHGTNGVGRTATARELVRRINANYPGGQVNLDLRGDSAAGAVTPAQSLDYVIQKFDPTIAQLPTDETLLRGRYQSLLFGRRALVLLDNAGDISQVAPFLPPPQGSLVLVTSWERMDSPDIEIFNRLLGKLAPADAERLLVHLAPRAEPRAAELAARCEYLPQALDGIARQINKSPNLSIDDLFALLDDARERLEITGAAATLQVSYGMLSEVQKKDWRRLAVFAADFNSSAAAWVWGRIDAATQPERLRARYIRTRQDLDDLVGSGMVEHDSLKDRYQLHNLARDFAAGLPELAGEELLAARLAYAHCYLAVVTQANELYLQGNQHMLEGLALFDREAREVQAAFEWLKPGGLDGSEPESPQRNELRARLPGAFVNMMGMRLRPEESIAWLTAGRGAARSLGDHALEVLLLGSLGIAYAVMDQGAWALACQEEALQIALADARASAAPRDSEPKQAASGSCAGLVRVLGNLGVIFRNQRKTQRAVRYLIKQLELARRWGLRREEGAALGSLGRVYLDIGDTQASIQYYEQNLAISVETGDRRARAIVLGGLGDVYRTCKDFERARQYLEEDIAITHEIGDRRGQAIASWMLGKVYHDQGDLAKAVEWMKVLVDYEKEIGHQDAAWHAEKIADIQSRI
jgi:tetratricopeptide (TPR) repeat protein